MKLLDKLDDSLNGIRGLLDFSRPGEKKKKTAETPEDLLAQIREEGGDDDEEDDDEDDYLKEARKLGLEARAAATERLKSAEEVQ